MALITSISTADAVTTISGIVGGAGISGVLVAVFGYLASARAGRQGEPEKAGLGISALVADSGSMNRLAASLESLDRHFENAGGQLERAASVVEKMQDGLSARLNDLVEEHRKLRRVVEDNMRENARAHESK